MAIKKTYYCQTRCHPESGSCRTKDREKVKKLQRLSGSRRIKTGDGEGWLKGLQELQS
jgi:hypothetical protein